MFCLNKCDDVVRRLSLCVSQRFQTLPGASWTDGLNIPQMICNIKNMEHSQIYCQNAPKQLQVGGEENWSLQLELDVYLYLVTWGLKQDKEITRIYLQSRTQNFQVLGFLWQSFTVSNNDPSWMEFLSDLQASVLFVPFFNVKATTASCTTTVIRFVVLIKLWTLNTGITFYLYLLSTLIHFTYIYIYILPFLVVSVSNQYLKWSKCAVVNGIQWFKMALLEFIYWRIHWKWHQTIMLV